MFRHLILRDLQLAFRAGGGAVQSLIFFALCVIIFALALGPDAAQLSPAAAPVVWASAMLATFLSLDRLFQADALDGDLDVVVQRVDFLPGLILAKALVHWLTTALPLIVMAPLLGLVMALPVEGYLPLIIALLLGSPALSLTGTLIAALTFPIRRASVLTALLAGPLLAPVLLFAVDAANAGAAGDPRFWPALMFLAATSLTTLIVAPLAGAAAIRFNMS